MENVEFIPQSALEQLLMDAATDPASRPRFLEMLLESDILIVPAGEKPEIKTGQLTEGTEIKLAILEHDGKQYAPFFTSEARLHPGTEYIALKARDFFEMTKGSYLVMNPGGSYGKEFYPEEIAELLDGSYKRPQNRHVVKEATEVLISQPAKMPNELIEALSRLYSKLPAVRQAFLCLYFDASREKEPGLLILLDTSSEAGFTLASAETGIVIGGVSTGFPYVDVSIYNENGIGGYFIKNKIPPFYKRK